VEGADALGLIAEVGIAIAGFAGVIAALRAPGGRIAPYAVFRIGLLLASSAEAVLLALLPFGLHFAGVTHDTIWAVSSSAMALLVATVSIGSVRLAIVKGAAPAPEDRPLGLNYVIPLHFAIQSSVVVLQLANAAFIREVWPFYLGLLLLTTHSLLLFAYVFFVPSRVEVQP
jgi:hypothetical protein